MACEQNFAVQTREAILSSPQQQAAIRLGEVVAASSTGFLSQCYQLYGAPPLGSFVKVGTPPIYAVVQNVSTEPLDPSRPVLARGEAAESEEAIYRDHPQIARLLTSRFEAVIVGYESEGVPLQYLPPLPPRVHSFVHAATPDEVIRFTGQLDFLRLLLNTHSPQAPQSDEVVAACLRLTGAMQSEPRQFLLRAGKTLAGELAGDLPRLNAIMRRVAL